MSINQSLYKDLYILRDRLKNEGRAIDGRAPTVCTDDALYEIVRLMPSKESDFSCVSGLGQTFIDKYSDSFLKVINKYTTTDTSKGKKISPSTKHTLKELEKKLVNINRRNRLLYMPKISNKYAFDLYEESSSYNPLKIILGKTEKTVICDTRNIKDEKIQRSIDRYNRAVTLIREVNKDLRDKGQFDLYVGYPFVKGRLAGEDFDVRAPLVLFPVEVIREAQYISVRLDDTKDVFYNNNLILAHYKFNDISRPLPNNVIDEINEATFINDLIAFYKNEGIEISCGELGLSKFKEYTSGEFPQYKSGEMVIEENIVMGKFSIYSSSLQKDFNDILEQGEINDLLANLLVGMDDVDYYSDSYAGDSELKDKNQTLVVSEKNLTYIGELNGSQEDVITAIKLQSEIVVQGPPGTGKSQTITSLISDFVNSGNCVLMVSEKKSALDVVYSRLGELSKFALIVDDVNNKELFYRQLDKMIHIKNITGQEKTELVPISENIDNLVGTLEMIAEKLYSASMYGIEVYKLYLMNEKFDLSNTEQIKKYRILKEAVPAEVVSFKYSILKEISIKFESNMITTQLITYKRAIEAANWLELMRENLGEYDIITLCEAISCIQEQINNWKGKNPIVRLFTKSKITNKIKKLLAQYFMQFYKDQVMMFFGNTDNLISKIQLYNEYILTKPVFYSLNLSERAYFDTIYKLKNSLNVDIQIANKELFNFVVYEFLQNFELSNRPIIQNITNFDSIILSLSDAINQKRKLTKQRLEQILFEGMNSITLSKRSGEIARIIEGKRKWSVSKFVRKFDFELFRGIKIWLLTPEVVSEILPLQVGLFDLLIFDEASQMYVEKGIPSIIRGKKVVIAGDSKQLRPSNLGAGRVESEEDSEDEDYESSAALEEESLLDLARFKYNQVLLNFHYRSKYEELIAFSNYAFYKGRLYVSPNPQKPEKPPIEVYKLDDGLWVNRSNMSEARKIIELLKEFFEKRQSNETVGIITFNSNQRDLIEDLIDQECAKDQSFSTRVKSEISRRENGEDIGLFVKNIENVQGDERDVIMFSIGYAKNETGRLIRNFGWLNQKGGENRLNVAISRAKKQINIITSIDPSELVVEDCKNDGPKFLKKYLEYCFAISRDDREAAKQVLLSFGDADTDTGVISFDSEFEVEVFDALVEKGFMVETQIGIGGYSIDLAIKKDNKYVLGIECDGKLYHSTKSARERDYHRQKYLESRGWKIHRIWSTNWWKNPVKEIEKIMGLVDSLM